MRIAYITGRYPAITHTFILREVRALRRLGIVVDTFSIWRTEPGGLLSPVDREESANTDALVPPRLARLVRAHVRAVLAGPRAYAATFARALQLSSPGARRRVLAVTWFLWAVMLWEACDRRAVRHVHAQLDGTAPMVAMLAVEYANAVRGCGEAWTWSHRIHGSKEFYDVRHERLEIRARSASFVACISDYTRSQVMAFVPEELWDRLVVVRCGVDLAEFAPRERASGGVPRILTVGRVDAMKGTVLLLEALVALRERGLRAFLTVVGDGPSWAKAVALADRLGVSAQVSWEGAVGQHRIRDYYAECDVFCLPSLAEGVPIVLMEAMAMEVPVVANAITGIVELVEHEVSGLLVRPGRLDQLTDALARLLGDPALRRTIGRAGRQKVAAEYDLKHNVRDLAQLFTDGDRLRADDRLGRRVVAADGEEAC